MFSDPISMTIESVVTPLPRIALKEGSAVYRTPDAASTLSISNQTSKGRTRTLLRLDQVIDATLRSTGGAVAPKSSVYLVVDQPSKAVFDYTDSIPYSLALDLVGFLTASGGANLTKALGAEI